MVDGVMTRTELMKKLGRRYLKPELRYRQIQMTSHSFASRTHLPAALEVLVPVTAPNRFGPGKFGT